MADGYIEFSTKLDNSDLEKQLKEAERDIQKLKKQLEQKESARNALVESLLEADEALKVTEGNIDQLKAKLQEIVEANLSGQMDDVAAAGKYKMVSAELEEQQALYEKQLAAVTDIANKGAQTEQEIAETNEKLEAATQNAQRLGDEYARAYSKGASNFNSGLDAISAKFSQLMAFITGKLKSLFVFSFILAGLAALKSYIMSSVKASDEFAAATNNLKAVLAGLATPILNIVIPAFTAMVRVVSTVLITLARLVDSIFKTNFVGMIADAQANMAASAGAEQAATDATDANTKARKRNTKALKEAARWLAAFDELNLAGKQNDDDYNDPLGGVGGGGGGGGVGTPDWAGIDVGKIDSTLAEIMLILGAALLAVGAILAFSGINIPMGLTLMAIGAAMIYTAATEQWGTLPAEVQEAITGALVITGIVMLVIGAVLAFALHSPLGVGLMAAGAMMLWSAVALNWNSMPEEIQGAVEGCMVVLGGALLVIGAILTFTMAAAPLGIGLMVLGAATLAGVVALKWDSMPEQMKKTVEDIAGIVGSALLALGAILTAVGGVAAPLGVGLLLLGAASLASSVALQWDTMPQEVRDMWSTIGAIIGAGLIVLGIICCFTTVGIPLGLALILAGAGSLAAVVAVNFDAIRQKVAEIWTGLKSWFATNVAPIFTVQFWRDKFKSIANGLISALNTGLFGVGTFINSVVDGISSILDFFGVQGWSFWISIPQIPYLAEGAVIPANRQFMAVLGDQSHGTNLEAPESLIRQIVAEETGRQIMAAMQMNQQGSGDVTLVLQVGSEELARATSKGSASLARRGQLNTSMAFL